MIRTSRSLQAYLQFRAVGIRVVMALYAFAVLVLLALVLIGEPIVH